MHKLHSADGICFKLNVTVTFYLSTEVFFSACGISRKRMAQTYFFLKVIQQRFRFTVASILVDPDCACKFPSTFATKLS